MTTPIVTDSNPDQFNQQIYDEVMREHPGPGQSMDPYQDGRDAGYVMAARAAARIFANRVIPSFSENVKAVHAMRGDGHGIDDGTWTVCVEAKGIDDVWLQSQVSIPAAIRNALEVDR